MLEGVEILIARMETNPDEFVDGDWDYFFEDSMVHPDILFTEDELSALKEAKGKLEIYKQERRRKRFTEQVIQHLFNKDDPEIPRPENYKNRIKFSKTQALMAIQQQKAVEAMEEYAKKYKQEKAI